MNFLVQENQVDTLHCSFLSLGETVVLFAEPTLRNSRSLEKELLQLNNQLAVLARENARKGRELAKTVGALAGEVEARKSAEAELRLYQADLEELVRERTEELGELNRALLRAQHAMDRSRDGVFWASWEGEIAYVNEAAAELAGRPGEECLALAVEDLLPSLTLDRWHGLWQDAQDHGVVELETHFWGREGGDRAVEVSASPVGHGGVEYLVCFVRNLLEPGPPER
ncbi:MAG: PAS domain-containing protein [Deltaproteobacteria bacterium]|nr:PAS domain-containing protein [Deltaproteobacteria bacterium]